MTDLQDTTISFSTTLASGSVGASALDTTGAVTNIINGLTRTTTVQNSDDVIISDASDVSIEKTCKKSNCTCTWRRFRFLCDCDVVSIINMNIDKD